MADKDAGTKEAPATAKDSAPLAIPGTNLQSERGEVKVENQIAPLVSSPTGPVPLSATVNDPKRAKQIRKDREKLLERERNHPRAFDFLDEDVVRSLSAGERRTVALQRGYKLQGRNITAESFLSQQQDDENLRAE